MTAALQIRRTLRLSPKQRVLLEFRSPCPECSAPVRDEDQRGVTTGIACRCGYRGSPQIDVCGALGEYGGGKTYIHMQRFVRVALNNPFIAGVHAGGDEPMSAIVAPTMSDMKKTTLVELFKALPEELIYRARFYGEYQDLQLINGHKILLYSAEGALNGNNLVQMAVDEVQEKIYDGKWHNYQGRVRDVRARHLSVSASGIAERGHVEDIFRRNKDASNRCVVMLYPEDNARNVARGYKEQLDDALPAARERDADGWLLPRGAMYPKFSRTRHVRLPPGLESLELEDVRGHPVSIAADFGRSASVVFGIPLRRRRPGDPWRLGRVPEPKYKRRHAGLLLVGQMMPQDLDAEQLVAEIQKHLRTHLWKISKQESVICLDPTAAPDQVREFQRAFPGVQVVQHRRGLYHKEEAGLRAVDRALLSKNDDQRLYVHPSLTADPSGRGVVAMFGGYLAARPKDKWLEHAADCVRYLTQWECPLPTVRPPVDPEIQKRLERAAKPESDGVKESII